MNYFDMIRKLQEMQLQLFMEKAFITMDIKVSPHKGFTSVNIQDKKHEVLCFSMLYEDEHITKENKANYEEIVKVINKNTAARQALLL